MWIFLEGGRFLSLSADPGESEWLWVKARLPGDIETDFPEAIIEEHPAGEDYRYRARVPRQAVMAAMALELEGLTYGSLRRSVCNRNRVQSITECDRAMLQAQERARQGEAQEGLCHLPEHDTETHAQ